MTVAHLADAIGLSPLFVAVSHAVEVARANAEQRCREERQPVSRYRDFMPEHLCALEDAWRLVATINEEPRR